MAVREWEGEVVFLHEVRAGAADRSYGVQVARLAGLPDAVVARAREVLDALEAGEREGGRKPKALIDDLPLFAAAPPPAHFHRRGRARFQISAGLRSGSARCRRTGSWCRRKG